MHWARRTERGLNLKHFKCSLVGNVQNEDESRAVVKEEGRSWEKKQAQMPGKHGLAVGILTGVLLMSRQIRWAIS